MRLLMTQRSRCVGLRGVSGAVLCGYHSLKPNSMLLWVRLMQLIVHQLHKQSGSACLLYKHYSIQSQPHSGHMHEDVGRCGIRGTITAYYWLLW